MSVEIDRASLKSLRIFLAGVQDEAPKILARSLNATATKARTEGSKAVRKQVNLSAAYVRDRMKVNKANYRNLKSSVATPTRGLLLSYYLYGVTGINKDTGRATSGALLKYKKGYFSVANLDQPLKVKVKPKGKAVKLGPEWFILPKLKGSNLPGLARRVDGKLKLHGPSLSQVFDDVIGEIDGTMNDYLADQMDKNIDSVLRGF